MRVRWGLGGVVAVLVGALVAVPPVQQASAALPGPVITTMAGVGDGCPDTSVALEACLRYLGELTVDQRGRVYVVERGGFAVRRIDPDGAIATVAGNGSAGPCPDGSPATETCMSPRDVAVDSTGTVYVLEESGRGGVQVRRVGPDGIVTTVAGRAGACPASAAYVGRGDRAADACLSWAHIAVDRADRLHIASMWPYEKVSGLVRRLEPDGTLRTVAGGGPCATTNPWAEGRPARRACLGAGSLAFDRTGALLVSDHGGVRRMDRSGRLRTVAGTAWPAACTGEEYRPRGCFGGPLAPERRGGLYLLEDAGIRVVRIAADGRARPVVGSPPPGLGPEGPHWNLSPEHFFCGDRGPALRACLLNPEDMAVGPSGDLFISDGGNNRIRRVAPDGTITTIAGAGFNFCGDGGPATQACLFDPRGVVSAPDGTTYVADTGNNRIRRITPDGTITTIAGDGSDRPCGDGGPAVRACIGRPEGLALDAAGNLFIAEAWAGRIRRITPDGTITTVAGTSARACGDPLLTGEPLPAGGLGDGGPATAACLSAPSAVAIGPDSSIYLTDSGSRRVRRIGPDGVITTVAGTGDRCPRPTLLAEATALAAPADEGPAVEACLGRPTGLAFDPAGNLYVTDTYAGRVHRIDATGALTLAAGSGLDIEVMGRVPCPQVGHPAIACIDGPTGIAFDRDGTLAVAGYYRPAEHSGSSRLWRIEPGSYAALISGRGTDESCYREPIGDGGPAALACLKAPRQVSYDPEGALLVADSGHHRIRALR